MARIHIVKNDKTLCGATLGPKGRSVAITADTSSANCTICVFRAIGGSKAT